jgi:HD-like signal output (HDOD) protein
MSLPKILARIQRLPPMPAIAVRLLEAANDPNADLGRVASWIEKDPSMTANLLRLCNSPFYGLFKQVTSVRQAASLLGMKKMVQIALTVLSSRYLSPSQTGYALVAGELWKNSVTSAVAAELLAEMVHYRKPNTAYTAGLLQDLGKIILTEFVGDALPRIWQLVEQERVSFDEAERRIVARCSIRP